MLPLKSNTETAKNSNIWRTLWKILFHKRTDKGGPHKNSGPHQLTTHPEQVIFPLSLTAHRCCELDHNFVQLEDRECIVSSTGLISSPLASFLGQHYYSFRPIIAASSLAYTSPSVLRHKHLGPIDSRIYKRFTCKYCRIFTNTIFKVWLSSQTVQLLYSHPSYFRSCSYLLF